MPQSFTPQSGISFQLQFGDNVLTADFGKPEYNFQVIECMVNVSKGMMEYAPGAIRGLYTASGVWDKDGADLGVSIASQDTLTIGFDSDNIWINENSILVHWETPMEANGLIRWTGVWTLTNGFKNENDEAVTNPYA